MSSLPLNQIICGNCFEVMKQFPDDSVDLVVTSPPYWGLRDYGVEGQLGLEDHPQKYIDSLVEIGKVIRHILKPTGLFWLNLGDTYAANRGYQVKQTKDSKDGNIHGGMKCPENDMWVQPKQLLLIPSRVAVGLQNDGWILRSDVIWHKCISGSTQLLIYINGEPRVTMLKDAIKINGTYELPTPDGGKAPIINIQKTVQPSAHITFRDGFRLTCSLDHRWELENGTIIETKNIKRGMVVRKAQHNLPQLRNSIFGYDWGWLIGLFLAEGDIPALRETLVEFSLNKDELKWKTKLDELLSMFGEETTSYMYGNSLSLKVNSSILSGIIKNFIVGNSASTKRLTKEVWQYGSEFLRGIMDGFLDGDMSYEPHNSRWRGAITQNYKLVLDLRAIAFVLGYRFRATPGKAKYQNGEAWCVRLSLKKGLKSNHYNNKQDTEVKNITFGRKRELYDITIDSPDHLFCVLNGAVSHNSNHMPDPASDRLTRSYEHFFMFSKEQFYYFDLDSIRVSPEDDKAYNTYERETQRRYDGKPASEQYSSSEDGGFVNTGIVFGNNPKGKNPGDVWEISTQHFSGSHFAVFPEKLIEKIVLCSSPKDGVVLDPFVGSGTTCVVASNLGRNFVGIDLKPEYVEMSRHRLAHSGFREEGRLDTWF